MMVVIFYWPTMFKDAQAYAHKCLVFQKCARRNKKSAAPLQPIAMEESFQQWGLDVIGEKFLHLSKQYHYTLIGTYYFTQWIELVPLKQVKDQEVINFL